MIEDIFDMVFSMPGMMYQVMDSKTFLTEFSKLSYDDMSKKIDETSRILGEMKRIRKSGLSKEIEETEKKLKKLKGSL